MSEVTRLLSGRHNLSPALPAENPMIVPLLPWEIAAG